MILWSLLVDKEEVKKSVELLAGENEQKTEIQKFLL